MAGFITYWPKEQVGKLKRVTEYLKEYVTDFLEMTFFESVLLSTI